MGMTDKPDLSNTYHQTVVSLVPRLRLACISLPREILKAIRAGVGFGSGTETKLSSARACHCQ